MSLATAFFILLVGLVLTFSRSGWIVATITLFIVIIYSLWNKLLREAAVHFLCIATISIVAVFLVLGWAVMPRASFLKGEASIDHRIFYNEIGIELVRTHPLGVGIGNEVLQAGSEGLYAKKNLMQLWLWQPVHNAYVLIASELGVFGLLVYLALLFSGFRRIKISSEGAVFVAIIVLSLLLFGLVDHFTWDLHAGRLMFWIAFGILVAV
jgi:O-antigen ligase